MWINSFMKVYDQLLFGGVKSSGFGKEYGFEVLDYYIDFKLVVLKML